MFQPVYGDVCVRWFAGIDVDTWTDTRSCQKDIDFLIYDKIRWNREKLATELIDPIEQVLTRHGLRVATIRYKYHDHTTYRRLLEGARAMLFLCEHETQGLAYQEALASNVPVLAWDNGYWLDPLWHRMGERMIPASSVPFFATDCGERFPDLAGFEPALMRFLDRLPSLRPREYVINHLSMRQSADIYARAYFDLLGRDDTSDVSKERGRDAGMPFTAAQRRVPIGRGSGQKFDQVRYAEQSNNI
jgi:glycosyltransferase involved in cell wall biosynthesis